MSASHLRLVAPASPGSIAVCITRFPSPDNTKTRAESITTWGGIVRGLENAAEHPSKEACPMFVGAKLGDRRTAKGSLRSNDNVQAITCLVGDYDGEEVMPEEGQRRLQAASVEALIYTSGSHTPEKPRWRVVAPLSGPRDPSEHHNLMAALNGALGGILAEESWTLSQSYFYGRVRGAVYETKRVHGQCIDQLDAVGLLPPSIDKPGASAVEKSTTTATREKPEARDKVADALKHVSADCGYGTWTQVLMAVHESECDGGFELADEWSATAEDRYAGSEDVRKHYDSFTCKPGGITVATLYKRARDNGWQEPVDWPVVKGVPINWSVLSQREPPARVWLINEWLSADPTLLAGRGGIGKSLLAQAVGSALALGRDYLDAIAEPRTVLAWMCEDDHDEIWRRQLAIARFFDVELSAFADRLIIVPRRGEENTLLSMDRGAPRLTPLMSELRTQVGDYKADVLILDNVGQTFGGNENCRHDVTMFMNAMAGIGAGRPVAPIVLAHPARAQGSEYAGNAAWENAARMRWFLSDRLPDAPQEDEKEPDALVRYLAKRKSNYTVKDYRRLTYHAGVLMPDAAPTAESDIERKELASAVVLDAVKQLAVMKLHGNNSSASPAFLPRLIVEYKLNQGCTRKELADAMRLAMTTGKLQRAVVGKHSNRSDQYGLVATA